MTAPLSSSAEHRRWMRRALLLARRAEGRTTPNPMVGAVLVRDGRCLGEGWHHRAGQPHAEIEALRDAEARGHTAAGATLYVTLEPCSTHGRTPPCTDAILRVRPARVVVAAVDPNPRHAGRGLALLREAGIEVIEGVLAADSNRLNEAFNHWIVHRTPFVVLKAAMTLDGKTATVAGESKWITSPESRRRAMRLRRGCDAILAGINTVLADDPALTVREGRQVRALPRFILDSRARTPLTAQVVTDAHAALTVIVVGPHAPARRVAALRRRVEVLEAPAGPRGGIDVTWLVRHLGSRPVTRLLVEGGGEAAAAFFEAGVAHRVAFFYAPRVVGGADARRGLAGVGVAAADDVAQLRDLQWSRLGPDLFLTARIAEPRPLPLPVPAPGRRREGSLRGKGGGPAA